MMKTAKEVLHDEVDSLVAWTFQREQMVIRAMEIYADQFKHPIIAPSIEQAAEERYPLTVDPEWERTDNESYSRYNGLQKTKREIFLAGANHLKQQGWKSKEEVKLIATRFAHESRLRGDITSNDTITSFDKWYEENKDKF